MNPSPAARTPSQGESRERASGADGWRLFMLLANSNIAPPPIQKHVATKTWDKKCRYCGTPFIARGATARYCSQKCKSAYDRIVNGSK
jgi:hypothetical protein